MRVIALYANRLAERGHCVTAILPRKRKPSLKARARMLLTEGRVLAGNQRGRFHNLSCEVRRLAHSGPVTERDVPEADAVIATWWETGEWVWRLPDNKGVKLHFLQDYEVWGVPNGDVARLNHVIELPVPKIVIAKWMWDLVERRGQRPLALIPNSVETNKFHAEPRGKQSVPTFGFVYTTSRDKGADIMIEAINRARQVVPELKVVSFGLSRPTAELPLPPSTEYHRNAPDDQLRNFYASCDAWLFGTRIEAFGLPILEAMACRTPVIGTPAGAAPELLSKGGGILVPAEDPAAMADSIIRVGHMEAAAWGEMSDAAFRTATEGYSWDRATDLFEDAILSTMRG